MKKITAFLLAALLLFSFIIPSYAADRILSVTHNNGVVTVTLAGEVQSGKIEVEISRNMTLISSTEKNFSGTSVSVGLPIRNNLFNDYTVTVRCYENGALIGTRTIVVTFGNINAGTPSENPLHASRAVMQPYADVFADPGLGSKMATLKKYDYVQILSMSGSNTAKVKFRIQSGNGTTTAIDNIHAEYHSPDDFEGVGYMSMDSFAAPSLSMSDEDKQRDAVELAYSRLGLLGVYNQGRRLRDCYVDCSALASYCWYQVGVDFTDGGSTTVKGIATWALRHHAVLWQAGGSQSAEGTGDIPVYSRVFNSEYFKDMKPGDLVCYTYGETFTAPDGTQVTSRPANSYDHVAIFVGCDVSSSGNVLSVTLIESSNANINTKISSPSPSSIVGNISMIVRPTGCEEIKDEPLDPSMFGDFIVGEGEYIRPVTGGYISSGYGYRVHPVTGQYTFHNGVDYAVAAGTPIGASAAGTVSTATYSNAWGNYVTIDHGNGFSTLYAHMSNYVVSSGQTVAQGQIIGYVGSTGYSTGPHLHFTIYHNGASVNPLNYVGD